jgi:hypothetical protein
MIQPRPIPPDWAVEAGIPYPDPRESFMDYCERLGIDGYRLLYGLEPRTAELANIRLATAIKIKAPLAFLTHWRERYRESHPCR